jgi:hypothetical protein
MEALLPQMTPPTFTKIHQPRISAMRFSERARERSLLTGHYHKVSVIIHQTPCQEIEGVFRSRLRQQIEVLYSVIGGEEYIHPAHASLHDVMRQIWNDHSGDPCHGARVCLYLRLLVNCCILSPEFRATKMSGGHLITSG